MEKKTQARGPGHPPELWGATESSAATCNIHSWMQGLDTAVSDKELGRTDDVHAHKYEEGHTHAHAQ